MSKPENYGLKIMRAVRDNPHFDKHERLILYTIALHRNEETGLCNPSVDTLLEETAMRKRTMLSCLKSLVENGCVLRQRGGGRGRSSRYEVDLAAIKQWPGNSAKAEPLSQPVNSAKAEPLFGRNSANSDTKTAVNSAKAEPRTLNSGIHNGPSSRALFDLWNATVTKLPKAKKFTDTLRDKCRRRLDEEPNLAWWREAFTIADQTPFCRGETRGTWKADLHWFVKNDSNAEKVHTGRYGPVHTNPDDRGVVV